MPTQPQTQVVRNLSSSDDTLIGKRNIPIAQTLEIIRDHNCYLSLGPGAWGASPNTDRMPLDTRPAKKRGGRIHPLSIKLEPNSYAVVESSCIGPGGRGTSMRRKP